MFYPGGSPKSLQISRIPNGLATALSFCMDDRVMTWGDPARSSALSVGERLRGLVKPEGVEWSGSGV